MSFKKIDPKTTPTRDLHQYLLGSVSPRPIALASTIDNKGNHNLAPYSFFNAFSSNPPTLVFSSNRRVLNNTTKDTLHNIQKNQEVVINAVSYEIVRKMTISSIEWPTEVSEFEQAGLTPIDSDLVKPMRVKESPVQMECKVDRIITLGDEGGAGHLIICNVVRMHIRQNILDENNRINPHKIDLMGRMGRSYYVRASGNAIHTIYQPVTKMSIGYQTLPNHVKESTVLSANDIGRLAGLLIEPSKQDIKSAEKLIEENAWSNDELKQRAHLLAKELISSDLNAAASVLWALNN